MKRSGEEKGLAEETEGKPSGQHVVNDRKGRRNRDRALFIPTIELSMSE
jgi:hypothetical protein